MYNPIMPKNKTKPNPLNININTINKIIPNIKLKVCMAKNFAKYMKYCVLNTLNILSILCV